MQGLVNHKSQHFSVWQLSVRPKPLGVRWYEALDWEQGLEVCRGICIYFFTEVIKGNGIVNRFLRIRFNWFKNTLPEIILFKSLKALCTSMYPTPNRALTHLINVALSVRTDALRAYTSIPACVLLWALDLGAKNKRTRPRPTCCHGFVTIAEDVVHTVYVWVTVFGNVECR